MTKQKIWLFSAMEKKKSKNMYYMENWKVNSVLVYWFLLIVFIQTVIILFTQQAGKIKSFLENALLSFSTFQGKKTSLFSTHLAILLLPTISTICCFHPSLQKVLSHFHRANLLALWNNLCPSVSRGFRCLTLPKFWKDQSVTLQYKSPNSTFATSFWWYSLDIYLIMCMNLLY